MGQAQDRIIDVVIVDKNPLVRKGLAQVLLEDGRFRVVDTVAEGESFIRSLFRLKCDICIIGWDMPQMGGRRVLEEIKNTDMPPKAVVYTGNTAPDIPRLVMQLGGAGFVLKSDPTASLIDTLLAIDGGRMVFPFMDLSRRDEDPLGTLTGREHELLAALVDGRANAQIAHELDISLNTVKFHLKNLYCKLGVHNRAQAVACYLKSGQGG